MLPVEASRVEHHLIESEEVVGRREESCVAGNATQSGGVGVVDISSQLLFAERFIELGGGNPFECNAVLQRLETGVVHTQRAIELLLHKDVQRLAADPLNEVGQQDESQVAIEVFLLFLELALSYLNQHILAIVFFDISVLTDSDIALARIVADEEGVVLCRAFPIGIERLEACKV